MTDQLKLEDVQDVFKKSDDEIIKFFDAFNNLNETTTSFAGTKIEALTELRHLILSKQDNCELIGVLLKTIRLFSRDKTRGETFFELEEICDLIFSYAGLVRREDCLRHTPAIVEAAKCLVNGVFHSQRMRNRMKHHTTIGEILLKYQSEFEESRRQQSEKQWIRDMTRDEADSVWFLYMRVAFVTTALELHIRDQWAARSGALDHMLVAIDVMMAAEKPTEKDMERSSEALKTIFNVYCHMGPVCVEEDEARRANETFAKVIIDEHKVLNMELRKLAINAIAVPPIPFSDDIIFGRKKGKEAATSSSKPEEFDDMTFTDALLDCLIDSLNEITDVTGEGGKAADLLGPTFQCLIKMCDANKFARRRIRMRVLPPLEAKDVQKLPEEGDDIRGKLIRMMGLPSVTKDVISEFLFVVCKKSVNRMIKYTGFGHSAGLLANCGLLGQVNQPKRDSDSEDSDTEDYNQIKDSVNPVTGSVWQKQMLESAFEGMSDEQKEYEAMKLVEAMSKMMDCGIVKPGTIGDDGKLREVSHVLELVKNAPEKEGSDEEED